MTWMSDARLMPLVHQEFHPTFFRFFIVSYLGFFFGFFLNFFWIFFTVTIQSISFFGQFLFMLLTVFLLFWSFVNLACNFVRRLLAGLEIYVNIMHLVITFKTLFSQLYWMNWFAMIFSQDLMIRDGPLIEFQCFFLPSSLEVLFSLTMLSWLLIYPSCLWILYWLSWLASLTSVNTESI